jgi:hypothetical protein
MSSTVTTVGSDGINSTASDFASLLPIGRKITNELKVIALCEKGNMKPNCFFSR